MNLECVPAEINRHRWQDEGRKCVALIVLVVYLRQSAVNTQWKMNLAKALFSFWGF